MGSIPTAKSYLPALTGIRAVAAFLVFAHHVLGHWFAQEVPLGRGLREGYVGVSMFFALSGYLITRTYAQPWLAGRISAREYFVKRIARIQPLYLSLLLMVFFMYPGRIGGVGQGLSNLTSTQGLFTPWIFTGLHPAWSLTVEECFYAVAPLLFAALFKPGLRLEVRLFRVLLVTAAFGFIGWSLPAIGLPGGLFNTEMHVGLYSIFGRFADFAVGIAVAAIELARPRVRLHREPEIIFFSGVILIASSLAVLAALGSGSGQFGLFAPWGPTAQWLSALGCGFLIWGIVRGSTLGARLLGNRPMEYLGRISFAAYLAQSSPLFVEKLVPWAESFGYPARSLLASTLLLMAVSAILYEGIERPAHRLILRRFARPASRVARVIKKARPKLRRAA